MFTDNVYILIDMFVPHMKSRAFTWRDSSSIWTTSMITNGDECAFLFRQDQRQHTWPPCKPSRFWQRLAKMRAKTLNAWDSAWIRCRSPCQLFRLQQWVIFTCERRENTLSQLASNNVARGKQSVSTSGSLALIVCVATLHLRLKKKKKNNRYTLWATEMHRWLI